MHEYVFVYVLSAMLVTALNQHVCSYYGRQFGHDVGVAASQPKNSSTAWVRLQPVQPHHDAVIRVCCWTSPT